MLACVFPDVLQIFMSIFFVCLPAHVASDWTRNSINYLCPHATKEKKISHSHSLYGPHSVCCSAILKWSFIPYLSLSFNSFFFCLPFTYCVLLHIIFYTTLLISVSQKLREGNEQGADPLKNSSHISLFEKIFQFTHYSCS